MNTKKLNDLAHTIINYSLKLKENSKVQVTFTVEATPLVEELIKEAQKVGAVMVLDPYVPKLNARLAEHNTNARLDLLKKHKEFNVNNYDAFVMIRTGFNDYESMNVPKEMTRKYGAMTQEIDDIRINEREWVLLNYPTDLDAYKAKMKYDDFYNFSMDVMNVDYESLNDITKEKASN